MKQEIYEEALASVIKSVEILKSDVQKLKSKTPGFPAKPRNGIRLASEDQLRYVKSLGGKIFEGMTHEEVSKMIDELKDKPKVTQSHQENSIPEKVEQYTEEQKGEFPDY